jgi:transposase
MFVEKPDPQRWIGLDLHKHYLIATGVDTDLQQVLGPQRVQLTHLEAWIRRTITPDDALVLEMTTNTWQVYDELQPYAHSVTVVHPPHVTLITRAQVMTDRIAALTLARLHAKGLLVGIWVPPQEVRDRRALVTQRQKMTRLSTQATHALAASARENRLHAVLHRHHLVPPGGDLFASAQRGWWLELPVSPLERARILCDLDTLAFAQQQVAHIDQSLVALAAQEERVMLLVQLPGVGLYTALTILAAIGDIQRFPEARHLVGYAGLGARIHDSGLTTRTGRITKAGRRDLRTVMVEAAHTATNTHPHWQAELARLEPRLGHNKAIVAIARKLLVAVWHILTKQAADRHADPQRVARKYLQTAYTLGRSQRPAGQSAPAFVRQQLDRLGIGQDLTQVEWRSRKRPVPLPPSQLPAPAA